VERRAGSGRRGALRNTQYASRITFYSLLLTFLALLAWLLIACGGNEPSPIPPTATPPVPTAPRPTALPSPTPTPGYLDLVKPDSPLPVGHLVFSIADETGESERVVLWARSAQRDELQILLEGTEPGLWGCATGRRTCIVGDLTGQVYLVTPPEALVPLVPAGEDLQRVFIAPSGNYAGVVSGGFMALLDLMGSADVINIPDIPAVSDVAWSADGTRLAFVVQEEERESLYVMRLGTDPVPPALIAQEIEVSSPVWAGNERKLAFTVRGLESPRGGTPQRRDVFIADLEMDEYLNLTEMFGPLVGWVPAQPFGGTGLRWSPDGDTLDFVWVPPDERPDRGTLYRRVSGLDPYAVMPVLFAEGQGWSGPRWSPDKTMEAAIAPIEARNGAGELWVSPAGEEAWRALSPPAHSVARFAWSPDGQYLAYDVPGDGIWIVPVTGGEPQRVVAVGGSYRLRRLYWLPGD